MANRAKIIKDGYKALKGQAANFSAELADNVILVDHDAPVRTVYDKANVEKYLKNLMAKDVDTSVTAQIRAVDGEVICLDRMKRDGGHCCVDRFQFNADNKVSHIDICWIRPK
jgi:hypothetical protein